MNTLKTHKSDCHGDRMNRKSLNSLYLRNLCTIREEISTYVTLFDWLSNLCSKKSYIFRACDICLLTSFIYYVIHGGIENGSTNSLETENLSNRRHLKEIMLDMNGTASGIFSFLLVLGSNK